MADTKLPRTSGSIMHHAEYLIVAQLTVFACFLRWRKEALGWTVIGLFALYHLLLPSRYNIRVDLFLTIPAVIITMVAMISARGKKS